MPLQHVGNTTTAQRHVTTPLPLLLRHAAAVAAIRHSRLRDAATTMLPLRYYADAMLPLRRCFSAMPCQSAAFAV